ncbi:MAG TPA: cysteine desulfurase NifS [Tepidisphaeraceae bacterium]|jgi:cysteine desulfurase|nr:cysteine desulfurase NifS [Tepidisphaeraceae bacterium]
MLQVYLDNNATTRPAPEAIDAMLPFLREGYGNPSSVHRFGQLARQAVDQARGQVAKLIGATDASLLFTGGGTESINTAVRGVLRSRAPRNRVVISAVEHSATRELCQQLAKEGAEIVTIAVARDGSLDLDELRSAITEQTAIVSIMWANNETGVIFPVKEIAEICRAAKVAFHCDATQAIGKVPVDVMDAGVDLMSFASHKFHGPKGIGALYVRKGLRVAPLLIGGPQERGRRGGTENVPGIVGMGVAAEVAQTAMEEMPRVATLRDRLEREVLASIAESAVNGRIDLRVPNTTNIGFHRLEAEAILLLLSEQGIYASAGSACSSGSLEPSPVLLAMGIDPRYAHGSIRFSLSKFTTDEEIDRTLAVLPEVIGRLRRVLPVAV